MDDRLRTMIQQLLGRDPTTEDQKRIITLTSNLPKEVLASPALLADIVLRADHLRQFEAAIKQATWNAQQRIHDDLPDRTSKAAIAALNKIRDNLLIDAKHSISRLLKAMTAWTIIVVAVAASAGWLLHGYTAGRKHARGQAAVERDFNRCIDAAEGCSMSSQFGSGSVRYDMAVYRTRARNCAAENADRRAGDS